MIRLQRCTDCGKLQFPSRDFCGDCLSEKLAWDSADAMPARVVARTVLHHSNEPRFRERLPLTIGLVRFEAGPIALCFLAASAQPGDTVQVRTGVDNLLEAA